MASIESRRCMASDTNRIGALLSSASESAVWGRRSSDMKRLTINEATTIVMKSI